jgi:hypothetical protein
MVKGGIPPCDQHRKSPHTNKVPSHTPVHDELQDLMATVVPSNAGVWNGLPTAKVHSVALSCAANWSSQWRRLPLSDKFLCQQCCRGQQLK